MSQHQKTYLRTFAPSEIPNRLAHSHPYSREATLGSDHLIFMAGVWGENFEKQFQHQGKYYCMLCKKVNKKTDSRHGRKKKSRPGNIFHISLLPLPPPPHTHTHSHKNQIVSPLCHAKLRKQATVRFEVTYSNSRWICPFGHGFKNIIARTLIRRCSNVETMLLRNGKA